VHVMINTWAEIPKDLPGRNFLPLGANHIWNMYREMGYERVMELTSNLSTDFLYDAFKFRLDESIKTSKALMEGSLETAPEKTMTYMFFPAITSILTDLQQGLMKLVYGNSVDAAYVNVNDFTGELAYILNVHSEDGIPVDWWIIGQDDEIMNRRHRKLGYKIRELPKKSKGIVQCGERIKDILRDIRNERAPQWIGSEYLIAMAYGSATIELYAEQSNYESFKSIWSGLNSKRIYGLPDYWFTYVPMPSILQLFSLSERAEFIRKMAGLTTKGKFYLQHVEAEGKRNLKENFPELFELGIERVLEEMGIPLPAATLGVKAPNLKKKETWNKEKFEWIYPSKARFFKAEDVGMSIDEACSGILFDVDEKTPIDKKLSRSDIISTGIGRNTKLWK